MLRARRRGREGHLGGGEAHRRHEQPARHGHSPAPPPQPGEHPPLPFLPHPRVRRRSAISARRSRAYFRQPRPDGLYVCQRGARARRPPSYVVSRLPSPLASYSPPPPAPPPLQPRAAPSSRGSVRRRGRQRLRGGREAGREPGGKKGRGRRAQAGGGGLDPGARFCGGRAGAACYKGGGGGGGRKSVRSGASSRDSQTQREEREAAWLAPPFLPPSFSWTLLSGCCCCFSSLLISSLYYPK